MRLFVPLMLLLAASFLGCRPVEPTAEFKSDVNLFGGPHRILPLKPFAGIWRCNNDATYALWSENGMSDEQINGFRRNIENGIKTLKENRGSGLATATRDGRIFGDLLMNGTQVDVAGLHGDRYDLYMVEPEVDGVIAARAWHLNNMPQPTDMKRACVKLQLVDDRLHFTVQQYNDSAKRLDSKDPELAGEPVYVKENGVACDITSGGAEPFGIARTYVFDRVSDESGK